MKALYEATFEDTEAVVDSFFENTFPVEAAVGIFEGEKAVSALYLLESEIVFPDGESEKAFYVYAVSTLPEYRSKGLMKKLLSFGVAFAENAGAAGLFLVPAEESLFSLYEKNGYKKAFFYKEKTYYKRDFQSIEPEIKNKQLTFKEYKSLVKCPKPVAVLGEGAFKSFFGFKGGEACLLCLENEGFLVYEKNENCVKVFELWGNEKALLESLFRITDADEIIRRVPCDNGEGVPYGMLCELKKLRNNESMFFGVPYST